MNTPTYYRIQGADQKAIITTTRSGSITIIEGTPEALEFLNLSQTDPIIQNPKAKSKQFRRVDDFANHFVIELEALPGYVVPSDPPAAEPLIADTLPATVEPDFTDIPEPDEADLRPVDYDGDGVAPSEPDWEALEGDLTATEILSPNDSDEADADSDETKPEATAAAADDEPLPSMSFVELRQFAKREVARLGRKADILATGTIVKGKTRIGSRKVWLNVETTVENALVTKVGNKWLFLKVDGAEYFAKETRGMVYRSV